MLGILHDGWCGARYAMLLLSLLKRMKTLMSQLASKVNEVDGVDGVDGDDKVYGIDGADGVYRIDGELPQSDAGQSAAATKAASVSELTSTSVVGSSIGRL